MVSTLWKTYLCPGHFVFHFCQVVSHFGETKISWQHIWHCPPLLFFFLWYWNFVVICYQLNFQYILTKGLGPERSWTICLISSTHSYIHIVCKLNAILLIKIHFNYQMAFLSIHLYTCPRCDQVPFKAVSNKKIQADQSSPKAWVVKACKAWLPKGDMCPIFDLKTLLI